jgi:hypothetical protein
MEWTSILAYITGTVDQELLLRNEYLTAENGILKLFHSGGTYAARTGDLLRAVFSVPRWIRSPARQYRSMT